MTGFQVIIHARQDSIYGMVIPSEVQRKKVNNRGAKGTMTVGLLTICFISQRCSELKVPPYFKPGNEGLLFQVNGSLERASHQSIGVVRGGGGRKRLSGDYFQMGL